MEKFTVNGIDYFHLRPAYGVGVNIFDINSILVASAIRSTFTDYDYFITYYFNDGSLEETTQQFFDTESLAPSVAEWLAATHPTS